MLFSTRVLFRPTADKQKQYMMHNERLSVHVGLLNWQCSYRTSLCSSRWCSTFAAETTTRSVTQTTTFETTHTHTHTHTYVFNLTKNQVKSKAKVLNK